MDDRFSPWALRVAVERVATEEAPQHADKDRALGWGWGGWGGAVGALSRWQGQHPSRPRPVGLACKGWEGHWALHTDATQAVSVLSPSTFCSYKEGFSTVGGVVDHFPGAFCVHGLVPEGDQARSHAGLVGSTCIPSTLTIYTLNPVHTGNAVSSQQIYSPNAWCKKVSKNAVLCVFLDSCDTHSTQDFV